MKRILHKTSLKHILIMLLFLSVLFGLRWGWSQLFYTVESPQLVNGVLDMRGIDLEKSPPFYLNGEWGFYPDEFVYNHDPEQGEKTVHTIEVPGDWSSQLHDESSYGHGTYRLRILIDPLEQPIAFWFQGIQASSEVDINGNLSARFGRLADSADEYKPRNISYTASYAIEGTTEIELLVRIANFDQPHNGGITRAVHFGSQAAIDYVRFYSIGFQLVMFIILVLHGIYACILYLFNREKSLLATGLLTLTVGILVISGQDNVLMLWLPINYTWAIKIKLLAFLWQNYFILVVFRKFSAASQHSTVLRLYTAALFVLTGILLVSSASFIHELIYLKLVLVFSTIPLLWFLYISAAMMFKQTDKDIIFLLLSATGIISNLLWKVMGDPVVYYPIDITAAIIGFSAYWFKKYFRNTLEISLLNKQLKEADKLKDQFLANTSHELRTPLHGIMNIAQTVVTKEKEKLTEDSVKDMELLITISRRMSYLLGDLLDVARLQEHRIVLKQEPLHIQSIVPGLIGMLAFMVKSKPVQLTMNIPEDMPAMMADEKRLVQILYNLLHNALKYTEEGVISISAQKQNGYAAIQVSDTGCGMDEEILERIFLPYEQRVHGVSDSRGLGLGLSICKQLVELHGSTITVQSKPGVGSTFSFDLPLANPSYQQQHRLAPNRIPDPAEDISAEFIFPNVAVSEWSTPALSTTLLNDGQVHILVVDDDPVNLSVLVGILSTESYKITTCASAREALTILDTGQWDLLIADVMMPHMSGYELTERVRERYSVSELPILLLTARSQPADMYTGFLAGANDYVTKPVDALELKYRIRALVAMKQSIHERLRMEAAYLQAQIHPHFLFNTINSIMALSEIDTDKMRSLGEAFTSFLRISFDLLNTKQLVELAHELRLTEAYLFIEQERFGERLAVVWELDPNLSLLLPPLSIQPLVENAVKHGVLKRIEGGTIHIRITRQESGTLVEVRDNGKGMEQKQVIQLLNRAVRGRQGIGVANTNQRLMQLYGRGLSISSKPNAGTSVSFMIPDSEISSVTNDGLG